MPSLRDIEKTLTTLWMNKEGRNWLIAGSVADSAPDAVKKLSPEVLALVDKKGVELYGNLINYGHHDVMSSIYPYCAFILGDQWKSVVDDYLLRMPPGHFNLNKGCRTFSEYITKYGGNLLNRYPYLAELADYEWIELEKMEESSVIVRGNSEPVQSIEQFAALSPVVNSTVTVRHYEYPVNGIAERVEAGKKPRPKLKKLKTAIAIYRDPETHRARFYELGEIAARLVEKAQAENCSYQTLLVLAVELSTDSPAENTVMDFIELVEDLQNVNLFVGSLPVAG